MIGLVLAAAAVGAVAGQLAPSAVSGQLEVIPSATVEARAGEAPIAYGAPPTDMLAEVVTPGVAVGYVSRRLELLVGYQLRIFWQNTSKDPDPSPLLLHMMNVAVTGRPTQRLVLKLSGMAYAGKTDYTYLPIILGQSQAMLTVPPNIVSANLTGEADYHLTPLTTAGLGLQASHNQPVGQTMISNFPLPFFTSFAATPGVTVRVSHTDDLSSAIGAQYQRVSNLAITDPSGVVHTDSAISAVIVAPTFGFHRILSSHSELTVKAGLAVIQLDSEVLGNTTSLSPIGSAALDFRLLNLRRAILQLKLSESLDYYLDPVLATGADHSYTTASLYLGLPKNWTIAFDGSFVTPLEPHPQGVPPVYYDEIGAAAQLAARHLLSNDLLMEFGGRWGDRSPFFTAPNYGFHQRQLFVFVQLTGTTHPTWLPQREVASVQ
jgi:hypothetical protein